MAAKTIILKGSGVRKEALASGSVTPGHLLQLTSAGAFIVHQVAKGIGRALFAVEDDLQGNGIDDVYATTTLVQANIMQKGDVVNAILATSQTIVRGDYLESAGNGQLQKLTAASQLTSGNYTYTPAGVAIAVAVEDVTTTSAVKRIAAEIL